VRLSAKVLLLVLVAIEEARRCTAGQAATLVGVWVSLLRCRETNQTGSGARSLRDGCTVMRICVGSSTSVRKRLDLASHRLAAVRAAAVIVNTPRVRVECHHFVAFRKLALVADT
jgi:hypothetical protein